MTVVETPPEAARRCPRCGHGLREDQDWCLNCGSAVRTRIATTPGWRLPLALLAGLLALVAIGLVLVIFQAADDADPATQPAAAQPTPAAPTPAPTPPPASGATRPPAAALAQWPAGTAGWTIVVATIPDRTAAEERAGELVAAGREAGVVAGDEYAPLRRGAFAVFSGRYESRAEAERALEALGPAAEGSFARQLRPRAPGG